MKPYLIRSFIWFIAMIMFIGVACNGNAKSTAIPTPTNLIIPSKTPMPSPTATFTPPPLTPTPLPPEPTTLPLTVTPPKLWSYYPENCYASSSIGYMSCSDSNLSIRIDIPDYWLDVRSGDWYFEGAPIGRVITAAPNLVDFNEPFLNAEGIFYGASDTFALIGGYIEFLDYFTSFYANGCDLIGRFDFNDGYYRGKYDQYKNCGGQGGFDAYVLSAVDIEDQFSMIVLMYIQVIPGDTLTFDQIIHSFFVSDL